MAPQPVPAVTGPRAGWARVLPRITPRVERSLAEVLREDRLLRWAFAALWAAALVPLFLTPFLPFSDMGANASMASLLLHTMAGIGVPPTYLQVNWTPSPYWTVYVLLALVDLVSNPLVAAKVVTAIVLLFVPLGVMRLLVTLRRSPRLALWAFLLVYDHNLYAGWHSLMFGFALSFFVIAWTIEARTPGEAARVAPSCALLGVTHIQAVWLVMAALPLLVGFGRPIRRRLLVHAVVLAGLALTVGPWLAGALASGPGPGAAAFTLSWHAPHEKVARFFEFTLDNFVRPGEVRMTLAALVLLVLGPSLLGLLPRQPAWERTAMPVALLAAAGGLYALLPFEISGPVSHWYTYPRFATVALLFLLLLPSPRLDGRHALALVPGLVLAVLLDLQVGRQFRAFGARTRPLLDVIAHVRPRAAMLPLVLDDADPDPDLKLAPYHQLFAYVTGLRKGYEGMLWEQTSIPLVYRAGMRRPAPGWDVAAQLAFTMEAHGKHYDYVLVQGFEHGDPLRPLQGRPRPRLVIETGRWRLYEITK